ncbi:MAG: hypothetical protein JXB39_03705 [Deltaproteobacteria bacterium]|nr:hypothetical protein [Deltaproteobacteria bacterium]
MTATATSLKSGRVYRTRDLAVFSANPTRWARRLVERGEIRQLAQGLFDRPRQGRFGPRLPDDRELMRAFLGDSHFVFTGPPAWNAQGLGSTALFAAVLVYNLHRSGSFTFGGQRYLLRRVRFPEPAPREWFVVDLFENADMAGADPAVLETALGSALRNGRFDAARLLRMAEEYGTRETLARVKRALSAAKAGR